MTTNAVVAFMDILGFREMIEKNKLDDISKLYDTKLTPKVESLNKIREVNEGFIDLLPEIHVLQVSDSIILWIPEISEYTILYLISSVRELMVNFLRRGVPLRGGISMGELSVKRHSDHVNVFGNALTQAYKIEKDQQWSGCTVDSQCVEYMNSMDESPLELALNQKLIAEYQVPKKHGKVEEQYVINWASDPSLINYRKQHFGMVFKMHKKRIDTWDVKVKLDNTIAFYKAMNKSK
ncbi:hypothetical protein D7Z26_16425 [Cohnella endophytica]|uniref:Adenylate/guanylate cyclase domain-containing protein n=1 Tax=Cohnella endophytica TaxID=2419778 RepID=A0A494XNM6_9BACL|nr:hypothetical protein [Cohnella endophytica]RKP51382.1 hypothetical protein D7Z26_16425 [Cohnella endophytica]